MLKAVQVRRFKSLEDTGRVELAPLTVLFGPNAAGKSNFLDAIQVLSRLASERTLADTLTSPVRGLALEAGLRIVVERPLRLAFQATPERIERLATMSGFEKLAKSKKKGQAGADEVEVGRALQTSIRGALAKLDAKRVWKQRAEFVAALDGVLAKAKVKVPGPARKAILEALSERDETAEPCLDEDGRPEPDADLRDTENVPLKEDIHAYFDREVTPHVADAWIDETKTKVGYEIPFTRHFYKYTPMRPLAEIEADIRKLESEIQGMLGEVLR